jgi:hypothetical protein
VIIIDEGDEDREDRRAAILCSHVARQSFPILRAVCDEPEMDEDSGWQFLCGQSHVDTPDDAEVWLVFEVLNHDPSLKEIINYSPGTVLTRPNVGASWKIQRK